MNRRGFSLVEMMVVIAMMGILMTYATIQFNQWVTKNGIDNQTRTMYAELMAVRSTAMFTKQPRRITIAAQQFRIYSSTVSSVAPIKTIDLKFPVVTGIGSAKIDFDSRGMTTDEGSICIEPSDEAGKRYADSVVVSVARIRMGIRAEGGGCTSASSNIVLK